MKRRRSLHFGSLGFAGLARAIIKNNTAQTTKHRPKGKHRPATQTDYKNSKKVTIEEFLYIKSKLHQESNSYYFRLVTLLLGALFVIFIAYLFFFRR